MKLEYLNEIAAIPATALLLVAMLLWLPHVRRNIRAGSAALTWLLVSLSVMELKGIMRMVYWDLLRPILRDNWGWSDMFEPGIEIALINGGINAMAGVSGICAIYSWSLTKWPNWPNRMKWPNRPK